MRERFSNEDGVALILALYLTAALSVVGAGLMFLSQVETYSSANYRVMSQARYGAEAGVYKAAHYLLTAYTPPSTSNATDPLAAYDMSRSPVQYQGRPVVLSTIRGTASNYPSTAVTTAFLNTAAGSLDLYPGSVAYTASATMVAMRQVNGQTVSSDASGDTTTLVQSTLMIAAQYWITPQLWIKGGIGFANLRLERSYYGDGIVDETSIPENGMALMGAVGYELLSARYFSIDLQGRLINGAYKGIDNTVTGATIGVGINWY